MSTQEVAKIAALVAGGAVIGAGLGLLYAPQAGTETRRQVKQYVKRAQVQASRMDQSIKSGVDHTIEYGKSWMDKKNMPHSEAA